MSVFERKLSGHQLADLGLIVVLALLGTAYAIDAYSASSHIMNIILILPLTVLLFALCVTEFVSQLRHSSEIDESEQQHEPLSSVFPVIGLFTVYTLTLKWLGFDVGTFLFVAAYLYIYGEKRIVWCVGYAFVFALLTALFFSEMLPYPMPMLILETAY